MKRIGDADRLYEYKTAAYCITVSVLRDASELSRDVWDETLIYVA